MCRPAPETPVARVCLNKRTQQLLGCPDGHLCHLTASKNQPVYCIPRRLVSVCAEQKAVMKTLSEQKDPETINVQARVIRWSHS